MARFRNLLILLGLLLTACTGFNAPGGATPTPFPRQVPSFRVTTSSPIPISLENLAKNPDLYVGATLHLNGQYRPLPRLACENEAFPSPATWGLVSGDYMANVTGMDSQLRALITEGQPMTVEGRWLKFEGPVGCGENAEDQTIWYLSTNRILDPHPLVRAQASAGTAGPQSTQVADASLTAEADGSLPIEISPVITQTATVAVTAESIVPTSASAMTVTPTPTTLITETLPTATPTLESELQPTLPSGTNGTVTPAGTQTPATSTPALNGTATATSVPLGTGTVTLTPSVTATRVESGELSEKGRLDVEDLTMSTLSAGSRDRWTMNLDASESITLTVAPGSSANILFSILDPNNVALVDRRNLAPAGEPEAVSNVEISTPGTHSVIIETEQGVQTDYAMMLMNADSLNFVFRGLIVDSTTKNDSLPANTDHFWFTNLTSGQVLSLSVTPTETGDAYVEIYGPDGSRELTLDDGSEGETEQLDSRAFPNAGMYGIRVAEFDFLPMSYRLTVTKS